MAETEVAVSLGKLIQSKEDFWFPIFSNSTSSQNRNFLFDAKQGTGKTNCIMLFLYELYRIYIDTDSEYGALPIVFSPLFEFSNIRFESVDHNLGPERDPEGIESLQYCFEMSNPPPDDKGITIIYIDFNDLAIEDIVSFVGMNENTQVLGHLQKMLEALKKQKPNYDINDFIEELQDFKPLYDALYYVFTKLKRKGFFNSKYHKFDWMEALRQRKPMVFNFGDINVRDIYNTLTGYFLRKLFELSNMYYNAYTKKERIERSKLSGEISTEVLSEDEEWLINNFYLSIFIQLSVNHQAKALAGVEKDIDEIQEDVEDIAEDVEEIAEDVEDIQEAHEEIQEDIEEIQKDVEEIQEAHEDENETISGK